MLDHHSNQSTQKECDPKVVVDQHQESIDESESDDDAGQVIDCVVNNNVDQSNIEEEIVVP